MTINVAPGEDRVAKVLSKKYLVTREPLAPEPGGDVAFDGIDSDGNPVRVGVERKSVANLVTSALSGELADQLRRMLAGYDVVVLLIAGNMSRNGRGDVATDHRLVKSINYDALWNELQRWQARGVAIQLCSADDEGRRLSSLYELFQRRDTATERPRLKRSAKVPLTTISGLGPKKMEALLQGLTKLDGADSVAKRVLGTGKVYKDFVKAAK